MDNLSPEMIQYGLGGIIALCVALVGYLVIYPLISGEAQAEKRLQGITENKAKRSPRNVREEEATNRRKQVAETLRELEERQKARERITLRLRLERAGLDITPRSFWIGSVLFGLAVGLFVFFSTPGMTPLVSLAAGFVGMFGLPRIFVNQKTKWRQNKFLDEFANAIDVIVRGVKSGLPLNECLGIIARESPSPIKEEFAGVVEQQRIGIPLSDCFERMMVRLPLPEVKFFAIVIGIQSQSGGNLSEALGNLSGVLRDRKRMAAKVKALSAEAKASSAVLGSLPFIVTVMVYITTPEYIGILFKTKVGQFLLLCAGAWMTCGLLIMRKMINFKY